MKAKVGIACGAVAVLAVAAVVCFNVFSGGKDTVTAIADGTAITDGTLAAGTTIQVTGDEGLYWKASADGKDFYVIKSAVQTDSEAAAAAAWAARPKEAPKSSGGSSAPSTPSAPSSEGQDGDEISLASFGSPKGSSAASASVGHAIGWRLFGDVQKAWADEAFTPEGATVKEDTPKIVFFAKRGEELTVVEEAKDGLIKVKNADGKEGYIGGALVRKTGEAAPAAWDGYAAVGAKLYSDATLATEVRALTPNDRVHVIDKAGEVVVVEADGEVFYMAASSASETEVEVPVYTPRANSAQSSGDSSGSSPSQSQSAAPVQEWTEEVL